MGASHNSNDIAYHLRDIVVIQFDRRGWHRIPDGSRLTFNPPFMSIYILNLFTMIQKNINEGIKYISLCIYILIIFLLNYLSKEIALLDNSFDNMLLFVRESHLENIFLLRNS